VNTDIKKISQCNIELTVTVNAEEILKDYKKNLFQINKMIVVPGFRKGKAPISMIESMYGTKIFEDFKSDSLEKYFKKAIEEVEEKPISEVIPKSVEWEKGKDFVATYQYEISPKVDIQNYSNLEIEFNDVLDIDSAVNEELNKIQSQMAKVEIDATPISNENMVELSYVHNEKENKTNCLVGSDENSDSLNKNILDKVKGDKFTAEIKIGEELVECELTIENVWKKVTPELNDEFAKSANYENLEDMKTKIRQEVEIAAKRNYRYAKDDAIIKAVIKANPFDVPQSIVVNRANEMAKPLADAYKLDVSQIAPSYYPMAETQIKRIYILNDLTDKMDIKIDEYPEIKDELIKTLAEESNLTSEEFVEKNEKYLNSDDFKYSLKSQIVLHLIENSSKFVAPKSENENNQEDSKEKITEE